MYSYCESVLNLINSLSWIYEKIRTKSFDLPIFLDLEDKQLEKLSKKDLTEQVLKFNEYFRGKNIKAGVYASKSWFVNKLYTNEIVNNNIKIWLAEWNGKNHHTLNYKVDLWQYTSEGQVNGIYTNVDLSFMYDEDNAENYVKGEFEKVKKYRNGSTKEIVFADINCLVPVRLFKQI